MILSANAAEKFYKYGEALLVGTSIAVGGYTVVNRVVDRYKAVPLIEARVTNLEHKASFLVKGMEKLTHTRYKKNADEE